MYNIFKFGCIFAPMFSLFQNKHPFTTLLYFVLASLFAGYHYFIQSENFYEWNLGLWQKKIELHSELGIGLFSSILAVNAIIISRLFNQIRLLDYTTFVPGMLYMVFSFSLLHYTNLSVLISDFWMLLALSELLKIQNQSEVKALVFNASLFLGIAITFHSNLIVLGFFPLFVLLRNKSFMWREAIMNLLGLVCVGIYFFSYLFYFGLRFQINTDSYCFINNNYFYVIALFTFTLTVTYLIRVLQIKNPGVRAAKIIGIFFIGAFLMFIISITLSVINRQTQWHNALFPALYMCFVLEKTKNNFILKTLVYGVLLLGVLKYLDVF
jgi:hypothetical protein